MSFPGRSVLPPEAQHLDKKHPDVRHPERVFLFDIDGTLLRGAGPLHGQVLVDAVAHVTGLTVSIDGIPVHGMLDQDILTLMLDRAGYSASFTAGALPAVMERAQSLYPARCPDLRSKVLPGVRDVLEEITAAGFPIGLVTGNLTAIGWCKMEAAGLRSYFQFGAFAGMAATRAALARIAAELAAAHSSTLVTHTGDAPSDIVAARANGFRSAAVATGMTSAAELAQLGPDLLLNDLSLPEDRLRLIYGHPRLIEDQPLPG